MFLSVFPRFSAVLSRVRRGRRRRREPPAGRPCAARRRPVPGRSSKCLFPPTRAVAGPESGLYSPQARPPAPAPPRPAEFVFRVFVNPASCEPRPLPWEPGRSCFLGRGSWSRRAFPPRCLLFDQSPPASTRARGPPGPPERRAAVFKFEANSRPAFTTYSVTWRWWRWRL